ncbi:DNA/RNA non-specific endonuclease [Spongiimicrobium sp. 2-473A-2-J]|uniref:DNA/RNA non-specific endonuclease n=1 Tax=Eudoraea algarum TaxID=3417568 RepID=UPI003D36ABC5
MSSAFQTPKQLLHECANRWEQRAKKRQKNLESLKSGDLTGVESTERLQKRVLHLNEATKRISGQRPSANLSEGINADIGMERVIAKDDFLDITFLERGLAVSRSVCKVNIYRSAGSFAGSGSGFLIGPNLVMTNNHVLPSSEYAKHSLLEFDYQKDKFGIPMQSVLFRLSPHEFFITDKDLDYSMIAVNPISENSKKLASYGWNKLMDEGKALIGEPLNIIQHPLGGFKQLVVHSNQLIDLLDMHAHYLTDTEEGSSGSLVCNNQWEVVALHHAGVPKRVGDTIIDIYGQPWDGHDPEDIKWVANEGIRISRILKDLEATEVPNDWEASKKSVFESVPPDPMELISNPKEDVIKPATNKQNGITWNIPLSVTVSIGEVSRYDITPVSVEASSIESVDPNPVKTIDQDIVQEKRVVPFIDDDYTTREGFDTNYLGLDVPLPTILDETKVSKMDTGSHLIPYHHFSIVINKERRLAYFCAANVDGNEEGKQPEPNKDYTRKGLSGLGKNDREAWLTDPRIPANHQLPDMFYNKDRKSFDKGHIVRRDDVAWGSNYEEVRMANGDTFHATNCSPQVSHFNQASRGGIWGKFENFVLKEAKDEKLVVFSGPVFRSNDQFFDGRDDRGRIQVKIPRAYWKILVCRDGNKLKTYAFILKQDLGSVDWKEIAEIPERFQDLQIKVTDLQQKLVNIKLPEILFTTDQMEVQ